MSSLPKHFAYTQNGKADSKKAIVGDKYRFTVITDRLIRCEYSENGHFDDLATSSVVDRNFSDCKFQLEENENLLIIKTDFLTLTYKKGERFSKNTLSIGNWKFGDKIETLKGTARTLDQANGEIELGEGVCSLSGYALLDDSKNVLIGEDGFIVQRESYDIEDFYFFSYGDDYIGAVKDYFRLTGIPPLLPAFAMGNWWSRYFKYTEKSYKELMTRFFKEDVPFSVSVIDMDWHIVDIDEALKPYCSEYDFAEGWTGYTWNKEFFPDYKRFLKWLIDHNLTPSLNLHPSDGVRAHEEMYPEMAKAVGIDPRSKKKVAFDMSNPSFIKAYFDILHHPYEKDGVRFWWLDWQQGTNTTVKNVDPLWLLNHYHTLDIKREGKREIIFSRFAGAGSQRFTVGFSGDTFITWESLDFQPYFTLTASNIGYPWWSHDIGGHMCGYRDDELNMRWIQLGVFSPITRLHSSNCLFAGREMWNYNPECENSSKKFLKLRHRLFPYLYAMNYRLHTDLEPLIQPLYYHYKNDYAYGKKGKVTRNSYLFGSELLVIPITKPSDKVTTLGAVRAWLPDGIWTDAFRGSVYKGNKVLDIYRKYDEMPVFAKAGAIVPMNILKRSDNTLLKKEDMEIFIFPGADNSFVFYEDDGDTYSYKDGKVAKTELTLSYTDKKAVFTISALEGDKSQSVEKRKFTLRFRGYSRSAKAKAFCEDKEITLKRNYDSVTNTLTLFLPLIDTHSSVTVELTAKNLINQNTDKYDRIFDIIMRSQMSYEKKDEVWENLDNLDKITCNKNLLLAIKEQLDL